MKALEYIIKDELAPYVNCIMVGENTDVNSQVHIPIYADGYPGIMFQQTDNGFYLLPKKKKLSELFLYGQTIAPIALEAEGSYKYIVFQLYPFVSKHLLGINPRILNDDCYDLLSIDYLDIETYQNRLIACKELEDCIGIISELMLELIAYNKIRENNNLQKSISIILANKGQVRIKDVLDKVHMTERTLERHFMSEVGLTPIQFAKIIQFQCSLQHINAAQYQKMIDVGLMNGFTDQSHFIRTFKKYTGQTPSFYLREINSNR